jgi:hypothetical protein
MGRIVDDVFEGVLVLLLGFDQPRPEAAAEDVVPATVALVERPGVRAVQVAHAVREARARSLEDQVVMVPHEAAHVSAPPVAALDPSENVEEDDAIVAVEGDRGAVVSACADVVVRAGGEVASRATHASTVTAGSGDPVAPWPFGTPPAQPSYVPGTRPATAGHCPEGRVESGLVRFGGCGATCRRGPEPGGRRLRRDLGALEVLV